MYSHISYTSTPETFTPFMTETFLINRSVDFGYIASSSMYNVGNSHTPYTQNIYRYSHNLYTHNILPTTPSWWALFKHITNEFTSRYHKYTSYRGWLCAKIRKCEKKDWREFMTTPTYRICLPATPVLTVPVYQPHHDQYLLHLSTSPHEYRLVVYWDTGGNMTIVRSYIQ